MSCFAISISRGLRHGPISYETVPAEDPTKRKQMHMKRLLLKRNIKLVLTYMAVQIFSIDKTAVL
jgi:hypothetical protein